METLRQLVGWHWGAASEHPSQRWYILVELILYVPHVVHQEHGAIGHHGKVGGVEVGQDPNIPNTDFFLRRFVQY